MQKISSIALSFIVAAVYLPPISHAQGLEDFDPTQPYTFTCLTSAYYSPLKTQSYYGTGDYWREIYLNGNGTNGADGTQVSLGMLAAPPTVPFGTKIYVDGFGLGTVHDRGGAIRDDRIDIYMGAGDEGLARALNWGKREKSCTIYPTGVEVPATVAATEGNFQLPSSILPPRAEKNIQQNLKLGSTGDRVKKLQEKLKAEGFFKEAVTGTFDEATQMAVVAFQVDREIVFAKDGFGAGYVGPLTWEELFEEANTLAPEVLPAAPTIPTLTLGARGEAVKDVQNKLKKLGLFDYPIITGNYGPVTKEAVGAFQLKYGIVASNEDPNFGIAGPKTLRILEKASEGKEITSTDLIDIDFTRTLQKGMRGSDIEKLQDKLEKIGFFTYGESTGYYGQATQDAVYAFQVSQGLIRNKTDKGAGIYGPITARQLDIFINDRVYLNGDTATFMNPYKVDHVITSMSGTSYGTLFARHQFRHNLDYGSEGTEVTELQHRLAIPATGFYDQITKDAVCEFQVRVGIVANCEEAAAGTLGPMTRDALNTR